MSGFSPANKHYRAILEFYGGQSAHRSRVPLIAHIDEGLVILGAIGATREAHEAFCLHPLLQSDDALAQSRASRSVFAQCSPDPVPLALALEYRQVANAYLSCHCRGDSDVIVLSEEPQVNDMLVADKVQNRKDFEIHHHETHENADVLARYFRNWLRRLGIGEERYLALARLLAPKSEADPPPG
jgi:hypothetical protein